MKANKFVFRGSDERYSYDDDYKARVYRYTNVHDVPWGTFSQQPGNPVRIIIQSRFDKLPLDVLYIPRSGDRLFVGFHGAETQSITDIPKFQFVRSFLMHRAEPLIFLADSTLLTDKRIRIGWMSGTPNQDLGQEYADLIQSLAVATKVSKTILVGHSAGATAAIRIGTMIPNSRAVAVNGQFSAEYYHPNVLADLKEFGFQDPRPNQEFLEDYRDRLDLRICLQNRAANSTFSWFTHADDIENSHGQQPSYPKICEYFDLPSNGGNTAAGDSIALCDWESVGINPHALPGTIIPFINEVLGEANQFNIAVRGSVDLQWDQSDWVSMPDEVRPEFNYVYRCDDPEIEYDPLYEAKIHRFESIEEIPWSKFEVGIRSRIIVQRKPSLLPIDMLFLPKTSPRLLVGFHGAEPRTILDAPKFQFLRSLDTREESLLLVSDSTLLTGDKINIGWMAGNQDLALAAEVSRCISGLMTDRSMHETILVGHSAGGFAAVLIGSQVPNSRAICINGQSVVAHYLKWTVDNLHLDAFNECASVDEMVKKYASRLDLRVAMSNRLDTSSFTFFAHVDDDSSFGSMPHFPLFANSFGLDSRGGRTRNGDAFVPCAWELNGISAHALPGTILPFIATTLGEESQFAMENSVDPTWVKVNSN